MYAQERIKDYLTDHEDCVNWIKIGDTSKEEKYINSVKEKIRVEGVKKSRMVHKGDFLLTNSMRVEGTAGVSDIIKAVEDAGYGAELREVSQKDRVVSGKAWDMLDELEDRETPVIKKRLLFSLGFLIVLLYLSMGHSY